MSEQLQQLEAALASLDNRSREVLMLLWEGTTQTQIANLLGIHEGTVSRIRTRAIQQLREVVVPDHSHPGRRTAK
jgi:RNA polymerase sigma factor (sigma-70 family)